MVGRARFPILLMALAASASPYASDPPVTITELAEAVERARAAQLEIGRDLALRMIRAAGGAAAACETVWLPPAVDRPVLCATVVHDLWSLGRAVEPVLFEAVESDGVEILDLSEPPSTLVARDGATYDRLRWRVAADEFPLSAASSVLLVALIERGTTDRGRDPGPPGPRRLVVAWTSERGGVPSTDLAEPGD